MSDMGDLLTTSVTHDRFRPWAGVESNHSVTRCLTCDMRFSQQTLMVLLAALSVGCTPPYPIHKRTTGPAGAIANLPDPSTVELGKTKRDDVLTAFREIDTGVSSASFFWGRWKTSSFAFRGVTDSGLEQIPIWSVTNFLVEFDETGTAKKSETLSDKHVVSELRRIVAEHPYSASVAAPLEIGAEFHPSSTHVCYCIVRLSATTVEFLPKEGQLYSRKCPVGLTAPVQQLTGASVTPPAGEFDPGPVGRIRVTLHFSQRTTFGTDIPASLKVNDLVSLLRFVEASRAGR
jgi:hypothetical protein